jgi:hypothetical protein
MKTVAEDKDTITIQFTRAEARNLRSAINYISDLFEYLDREALDGYQMTMEEADQLADEFSNLTTAFSIAKVKVAGRK